MITSIATLGGGKEIRHEGKLLGRIGPDGFFNATEALEIPGILTKDEWEQLLAEVKTCAGVTGAPT